MLRRILFLVVAVLGALTATLAFVPPAPSICFSSETRGKVILFSSDPDDDELIRLIRGPLGAQKRVRPKCVMVLSDGTGLTAKSAIEKTITSQYNGCDERFFSLKFTDDDNEDDVCELTSTRMFPFIQSEAEVAKVLKQAEKFNTLMIYTFADPELREQTARMCELAGIQYVDLLGPMFDSMTTFFNRKPVGKMEPNRRPNIRRALSDSYFRRIEAVEYTLKCDDGMSPHLLNNADVILLGVSRTGKTPLSVVLSHTMGLKVANIPLVVDLPPPRQLFEPDIDPQRVFCLTLDTAELLRIRENRLKKELKNVRSSEHNTYADPDYLRKDVQNAKAIAIKNRYTIVDVTGRAVEDTASFISSLLNQRFPDSIFSSS